MCVCDGGGGTARKKRKGKQEVQIQTLRVKNSGSRRKKIIRLTLWRERELAVDKSRETLVESRK